MRTKTIAILLALLIPAVTFAKKPRIKLESGSLNELRGETTFIIEYEFPENYLPTDEKALTKGDQKMLGSCFCAGLYKIIGGTLAYKEGDGYRFSSKEYVSRSAERPDAHYKIVVSDVFFTEHGWSAPMIGCSGAEISCVIRIVEIKSGRTIATLAGDEIAGECDMSLDERLYKTFTEAGKQLGRVLSRYL